MGTWRSKDKLQQNVRLDDVDERILWELVGDSRIPNNLLAERVGVSPSTTIARVRALRESGVLQSFNAQVDLAALGLPLQAMIAVRLKMHARSEAQAYLRRALLLPPVVSIMYMGGPDDFLIHAACTSSDHLRDFVSQSLGADPAVASTQTSIVFDHLIGAQHMNHLNSWDDVRTRIS